MRSPTTRQCFAMCLAAALLALAGPVHAAVVINEILYHPLNGAVQVGEDAEDLQFVELHNAGSAAVDVSGWTFAQGFVATVPAGTTLAAGAYLVVARDPALLAARGPAVPAGVAVVPWTSGDLSNAGDTVRLSDASGQLIDEVTYDDAGLWPAAADGLGSSLELTNPAYDGAHPLAWRASAGVGGTPGARNGAYTEGPLVLVESPERGSVVTAFGDVSVTFAEPVTGVAAANLVVDGHAATAVTCPSCAAGVGAGPWVFTGFGTPVANPYAVTLAAGAIRDLDGHAFAGDTWQNFLSVPKIVLNELHYNPASSTDAEEFIELINADSVAIDVSGWRLAEFGSPGCTFPAATLLAPGAFLVCAKDPAALQAATGYLTPHSWGVNDSLSNGGEPVTLLNASGAVVDRVVYADSSPWPNGGGSPDGHGPSLELVNPGVDNAAGQNWHASLTENGTPGAPNGTYSAAPAVASELPARGEVVLGLTQIAITFTTPVTGVAAGSLQVNGIAALQVTGAGAGPYVFTVDQPPLGVVGVVLSGGGIVDGAGTPFAGDSWLYFSSLPRVVLNEIHYHPAASAVAAGEDPEALQFVELVNREATPVDLSGWSFSEGLDVTFQGGTVLPAGGFLVLASAPAFLAAHATIPAGVPVLAWTSGDLSNGGEHLELIDAYGHVLDEVTYNDKGEWPDAPDGDGPSLELLNPGLPNDGGGAWAASTVVNGTPGAPNGVYQAAPAPVIFGVRHQPPLPTAGQALTITATVVDDTGSPKTVTLLYRPDQDPPVDYTATPMFDDGLHGDGDPGDGRYGVVVPGLSDGQQLDFYVEAGDGTSTGLAPVGHATPNRFGFPSQTFLAAFSNEVLPTDQPVFHVWVTLNNKHNQEALNTYPGRKEGFDATFVDGEGTIWYNVIERFRGQSSLFKLPSSYNIEFPSNRKLSSPLGFPVQVLQLNAMRPMAQWLGFNLFNRAGMPAPKTAWARLRYTGINYDSCCTGQNGFYGLYVVIERYDDDFLDAQGGDVPDRGLSSEGNLYRGRNDANLRWEGTDPATYGVDAAGQNGYEKYNNDGKDFWGDLLALCDAVSNTPAERWVEHVRAHVDPDNWARYFALNMLLGNREGGLYLDTGDDYFIYFPPAGDPLSPAHPDFGTEALPDDRLSAPSKLLPWDTDAVMWDAFYGIWRTTVTAPSAFLRHNAFAPIFVKTLEDLAANEFSPDAMAAVIDAMPDAAFGTSEGSDLWPETKAQYKAWIANQVAAALAQTVDHLTLDGAPEILVEGPEPVAHLTGSLQQAGTHALTVNGQPVTDYSVFQGTWSVDLPLRSGPNAVLVQAWDRDGAEKERVEAQVFYNPAGGWHLGLAMRAPRRMVNDKTLTIEAAIVDAIGRPAYDQWDEYGTVSVVRLPDRTPVGTTVTVFENHIPVPDDAIHFLNGWGSVSFTLDEGAAFAPGDLEVTVSWHGLTASRTVTVLANPTFRDMSGTLTGPSLVWGPNENIRITGGCTVPAGSTLTILPGTIVQVNTTGTLENGTLVVVNGELQALGTRDNPIFFFSERGPAAMRLTQSGSASNGDAWRGFQFFGGGSSTLRQVILTGAGNGNVVSHPRPPILGLFNTHSLFVDRSVFADDNGMVFSGQGTGTYTVRKTLLSRIGIGAEFFGNGHTLRFTDSWVTGAGRAPESENLDGDLMHVDGAASNQILRSSILNDGGDDAIDHSASTFRVEHSIISHARDKGCSMTGGHATLHNVLMFATASGIRGTASTSYTTLAVPSPIATVDDVETSILWPASVSTCAGTMNYTDVGNPADLGCGTGNLSADPQFTDTARFDYNPRSGSPALTAGPNQDRIGWLGFPYGAVCATTADCNDTNACTTDVCVDKLCTFTPIVGCTPCDLNEDCDDSDPCTVDTCAADGACQHTAQADGASCDDGLGCTSPDTCQGGTCRGPENCPLGATCNTLGACEAVNTTLTFQQDVDGYTGCQDTFLHEAQPATAFGADVLLRWDLEDPAPSRIVALLRFDDLFGAGARQIPEGSTITSATLALYVEDPAQIPAGTLHAALAPWDEATTTWNSFGGDPGVQDDEWGPAVGDAPVGTGTFSLDVTATVQAWQDAPATNLGWLVRPGSWDGIRASSSESATVANRPRLSVTFVPPFNGCSDDAACDDGLTCNGAETCSPTSHRCVAGKPMACDDGVACTADACDEVTDLCTHAPSAVLCDDGNLCTDDACDPAAGCRHTANAAPCDDGNACTDGDACSASACLPGPARACDDGVACTTDACDPATGCTALDACPAGQVCNTGTNACEAGPTVVTFQDGQGDYDGTVDTYVQAGQPDTSFATSVVLIVDGPTPAADLRQILLRFDDLFGDGAGQIPQGARIAWATLTLYVSNPSGDGAQLFELSLPWSDTDTWSSLGDGVQPDGIEAADTPAASGATNSNKIFFDFDVTASLVAWSGGAADLGWAFIMPADGTDSWQFSSSEDLENDLRPRLTVAFVPCDPGYVGNGVTCSDLDECGLPQSPCDPHATCANRDGGYDCACLPGWQGDGTTCADVDECAATPCGAHATCTNQPGTYGCACDGGFEGDGVTCTDVDECLDVPAPCDPHAACVNDVGTFLCTCDDGWVGNGLDCGECPGGADQPCSGHGTCGGSADAPACACEPHFDGAACDQCASGYGAYPACVACVDCDDGNPCTTDTCNPDVGCYHVDRDQEPCDDGDACTAVDACLHGACGGVPVSCDDGNPCTTDTCDPLAGCQHAGTTGPCDDGDACTTDDACTSGACLGVPVTCDDGNPCTADSCVAGTGCLHVFAAGACNDQNPCTIGDACASGLCVGTPLDCDDGDPCTADTCTSAGGCDHAPVTGCCFANGDCTPPGKCLYSSCDTYAHLCKTPADIGGCCHLDADCDDGNPATADTCEVDTRTCVNAPACTADADCDDGEACTADACDPATGKCSHEPEPGCCPAGTDCAGTPEQAEPVPDEAGGTDTVGELAPDASEAVAPDTASPDTGLDAANDGIPINPHDVDDDTEGTLSGGGSSCRVASVPGYGSLLALLLSGLVLLARRPRRS
jgi:hypothetical protein